MIVYISGHFGLDKQSILKRFRSEVDANIL
jgi:hypothetical protein